MTVSRVWTPKRTGSPIVILSYESLKDAAKQEKNISGVFSFDGEFIAIDTWEFYSDKTPYFISYKECNTIVGMVHGFIESKIEEAKQPKEIVTKAFIAELNSEFNDPAKAEKALATLISHALKLKGIPIVESFSMEEDEPWELV